MLKILLKRCKITADRPTQSLLINYYQRIESFQQANFSLETDAGTLLLFSYVSSRD